MNNEEKAKQIAEEYPFPPTFITNNDVRVMMENSALQMAEWKDEQIISLLPQIITCVYQGFTQCASDEVILKELTNLIKQAENYAPK